MNRRNDQRRTKIDRGMRKTLLSARRRRRKRRRRRMRRRRRRRNRRETKKKKKRRREKEEEEEKRTRCKEDLDELLRGAPEAPAGLDALRVLHPHLITKPLVLLCLCDTIPDV